VVIVLESEWLLWRPFEADDVDDALAYRDNAAFAGVGRDGGVTETIVYDMGAVSACNR
jgi:hypothetical protein